MTTNNRQIALDWWNTLTGEMKYNYLNKAAWRNKKPSSLKPFEIEKLYTNFL